MVSFELCLTQDARIDLIDWLPHPCSPDAGSVGGYQVIGVFKHCIWRVTKEDVFYPLTSLYQFRHSR